MSALKFSLVFLYGICFCQYGRYGKTPEDSIECLKNISLYQEYFNQKMYEDAYPFWQNAMQVCPAFSEGTYVNGTIMLTSLIDKEKDPERKKRLIDTLFITLNNRIKYFGNAGYVYGLIGLYQINYTPTDMRMAYLNLMKSIDLEGEKSTTSVLSGFVYAIGILLGKKEIDEQTALQQIIKTVVLANKIKNKRKGDSTALDNIISQSTSLLKKSYSCEKIEGMVSDMVGDADLPDDIMDGYLLLFNKCGCTKGKTYYRMAEKAYQKNPGYESAKSLGNIAFEDKDYEKALKYYKDALSMSDNEPSKKEEILLAMAKTYRKMQNYPRVRDCVMDILSINKMNYDAYLLLADAYASASGCGSNECEKNANYWVAVDVLMEARSLFPDKAQEINKMINSYSYNFPKKTECFFYGITEGSEYQVGCWINRTTRVRFAK